MRAAALAHGATVTELELERAARRSEAPRSVALTEALSAYDAALSAVESMTSVERHAALLSEHQGRGAFGPTSALLAALLDYERSEREALSPTAHRFHTGDPASDSLAGGPATRRPVVRQLTSTNSAPLSEHQGDAAEDRRQRELGAARRNPERYAVWVHTGGAQYDGGALALATHRLTEDGREVEAPHYVLVASVVAQPVDPRAQRLRSVQWRGAAAWTDSARLADVGHSPRQHTSAQRFAVVTPEGERDHNGRHNGEPVQWVPLSADGAAWLHAVAGTRWEAPASDSNDGRRIVGAVAVPGAASRTHRFVAVSMADGGTYVRTRGLDHAGRSSGMDAHAPYDPRSARWITKRQDLRRRSGVTGDSNAQRMRSVRASESVALAVEALRTGEPVRSNTRVARALRAAAFVALVTRSTVADVLATVAPE